MKPPTCMAVLIGVATHVSGCILSRSTDSKNALSTEEVSSPGDFETLLVEDNCTFGQKAPRANSVDTKLAVDSAFKIVGRLHRARIPDKRSREAVAEGIPLVETVWGIDDEVPLLGPGNDDKPFSVFVKLTVSPGDTKCTGKVSGSGETIEFVRIVVDWWLEGKPMPRDQWLNEGHPFYNYGVRLRHKRGEVFFLGRTFSME